MNPPCARCGKIVYPTEKVSCLDKNWHKGCFHCEVCKMTLNMKNYKGYDKKPYCNASQREAERKRGAGSDKDYRGT
uniref:LIM zinc-binding domain-containing protein n=1 Tax=Amphilophus citrinellus TaxID=61819 RepID=A0A3Q0T3L0_AMPCI